MNNKRILIIGGGPAGLTAGIYASRAGADVIIIEKAAAGGQMNFASEIENYPALDGINGVELSQRMREQALKYGAKILSDEIVSFDARTKSAVTAYNGVVEADGVIIATGAYNTPLSISGEEEYIGAGLSYCAVCDGGFFRNKTVAVAGGGNTAFKDALYLARLCERVYIIHRREGFRAESIYVERAKATPNIQFVLNATVTGLSGKPRLDAIEITDTVDGEKRKIAVDGLFVALGTQPMTQLFKGQLSLDERGYILTDENMKTDIEGIYAAGDVRAKPLKQIITAAADGAIAAEVAVNGK